MANEESSKTVSASVAGEMLRNRQGLGPIFGVEEHGLVKEILV